MSMLSSFFKKEVIFCVSFQHDWTILQYYTELPNWKEMIRNAICQYCFDSLYYDDYVPGPTADDVQQVSIHADIADVTVEFLQNRHGFTLGHPNKSQDIIKQMNDGTCLYKRFTEKQFYAFVKDLEKMKITPDQSDLESSLFEHLKRFDEF